MPSMSLTSGNQKSEKFGKMVTKHKNAKYKRQYKLYQQIIRFFRVLKMNEVDVKNF